MPRLPVTFLAPVPDFKGGAERSLMDLMANPAIAPHLVVPMDGPLSARARELDIPVDVVDFGAINTIRRPFKLLDGIKAGLDFIRAACALNAITRQRGTALVHSNGLKAHAIAIGGRWLGGKPAVIYIRDIANTALERATWKAFQMASTRTILVSRACWEPDLLPGNTDVVYNGFNIPPQPQTISETGDAVIGFAGRLHPAKGLHTLLDSLASVRRQGMALRLIVRGAFAAEVPDYEGHIHHQISTLGLQDAVTFEGFVADPDAVYRDVDIICVPSTTPDPLPRTVMEGMGRGLTVIASRSGGIPEMIVDGETGFIADTPEEQAAALLRLARDPELRRRIGVAARVRSLQMFSMERLHSEITAVYAKVVSLDS